MKIQAKKINQFINPSVEPKRVPNAGDQARRDDGRHHNQGEGAVRSRPKSKKK
jgi:hypothetical protein